MKRFLLILAVAAVAASCDDKNPALPSGGDEPAKMDDVNVVVEPVITRALSLNFKAGNRIGLDIVMSDGSAFASNACMTYAGTCFSGDLKWYADGGQASDLTAYHPYQEGGFPQSFTVESDQSAGTDPSDFMVATASQVYPAAEPVLMNFKHLLSQINIIVENKAGAELESVVLRNLLPTAKIVNVDGVWTAEPDPSSTRVDIKAEAIQAGASYCVIVAPQSFDDLAVSIDVKGGSTLLSGVAGAELLPGYSYDLHLTVQADQVDASIGGEIENWEQGGSLDETEYAPSFTEGDGYFEYDGTRYNTVTLSDGSTWMATPLSFVPAGKKVGEPSSTPDICYPYEVESGSAVAQTDPAYIAAHGYLYNASTFMGVDITDDNHTGFEGAQGICPPGWHIPTRAEWVSLVGHADADNLHDAVDNEDAVFFNKEIGYADIPTMNEGGFNFVTSGMVYNGNYQKLMATADKCSVAELVGGKAMSVMACSTGAQGTKSDGTTSHQMFTVQTTFTSPRYTRGRVAVAKTAFTSYQQVRCVKDKQ